MTTLNNLSNLDINRPVFLIGFMGCGKTTMGKKIARKIDLPFIDMDQQIVEQTGMSIANYFSLHGEDKFRELESQILRSIPQNKGAIISTGGGTPCFNDNMQWMNEMGISVYLKLPAKALLKRLSGKEGVSRPLLQGKSEEELLDFIINKLNEREVFYQKAHLVIETLNANPPAVLDLILTKLQSK